MKTISGNKIWPCIKILCDDVEELWCRDPVVKSENPSMFDIFICCNKYWLLVRSLNALLMPPILKVFK